MNQKEKEYLYFKIRFKVEPNKYYGLGYIIFSQGEDFYDVQVQRFNVMVSGFQNILNHAFEDNDYWQNVSYDEFDRLILDARSNRQGLLSETSKVMSAFENFFRFKESLYDLYSWIVRGNIENVKYALVDVLSKVFAEDRYSFVFNLGRISSLYFLAKQEEHEKTALAEKAELEASDMEFYNYIKQVKNKFKKGRNLFVSTTVVLDPNNGIQLSDVMPGMTIWVRIQPVNPVEILNYLNKTNLYRYAGNEMYVAARVEVVKRSDLNNNYFFLLLLHNNVYSDMIETQGIKIKLLTSDPMWFDAMVLGDSFESPHSRMIWSSRRLIGMGLICLGLSLSLMFFLILTLIYFL